MNYARFGTAPTVHILREGGARSICNRPYVNQRGEWQPAALPDPNDPDARCLICGECYTRLKRAQAHTAQ
jgi:hypothetical protein